MPHAATVIPRDAKKQHNSTRNKVKLHTILVLTIGMVTLILFCVEPQITVLEEQLQSPPDYSSPWYSQWKLESQDGFASKHKQPKGRSFTFLKEQDSSTTTTASMVRRRFHGTPQGESPRYGMIPKHILQRDNHNPSTPLTTGWKGPTPRRSNENKISGDSHYTLSPFTTDDDSNQAEDDDDVGVTETLGQLPHIVSSSAALPLHQPRIMFLQDDDHTTAFGRSASNDAFANTNYPLPPMDEEEDASVEDDEAAPPSMPYGDDGSEDDDHVLPFERRFYDECEPIRTPQVHPTCNSIHEMTMEQDDVSLLSTRGSWRTAWTVQNDTAVMKVLHWDREFNSESFQNHAMDVIVSDLLTASPYVIDAYSFCGQSILQEWAPSGGREHVKSYDVRNRERLRIARDLARGLADLQSLQAIPHQTFRDENNRTAFQIPPAPPLVFAHNDINIANTIYVDGKVKWNDFNIGVLLRTEKGSNFTKDCGAPVRFRADLWRSPEEVRNESYVDLLYTDMYGLGNILYQVMTRHQPWTHKEPEGQLNVTQIVGRKREGRLPTLPEKYQNTTNRDLQTMVFATMSCYHPVPSKRLTAYELAHALSLVYDRLQQKQKVPFTMLRDLFMKR